MPGNDPFALGDCFGTKLVLYACVGFPWKPTELLCDVERPGHDLCRGDELVYQPELERGLRSDEVGSQNEHTGNLRSELSPDHGHGNSRVRDARPKLGQAELSLGRANPMIS